MRAAGAVARRFLRLTFVDAIRSGAPLPATWSFGLRSVALIGAVAFVLAALLALFAPVLRAHTELAVGSDGMVLPTWSAPLVLWVLVVALTLAATAIIHLHPVLKFVGLFLIEVVMVPFAIGAGDNTGVALACLIAPMVVLLALILVRWRARFHPGEFVVAAVAIGLGTLAPMIYAGGGIKFGLDQRPLFIEGVLVTFTQYALPLMLVAGYALAQVTIRAATDLGPSLAMFGGSARGRRGLFVVLIVLGLIEAFLIAWHWLRADEAWTGQALVLSAMLAALFVLFAAPLWARAGRVGLPPVHEVDEGFSTWLYPIALAVIGTTIPVLIVAAIVPVASVVVGPEAGTGILHLADFSQTDTAFIIWRSLIVVGLLIAGWVFARRGRMAGPLAAAGTAAVIAFGVASQASGLQLIFWTGEAMAEIGVLIGTIAFVVQLIRRRVDQRVLVGMIGLLAVGVLFPFRHVLAEPVDQLVGVAGGALVVFGVGWQVLTGAGFTRESNRIAPAPARVLLFIANIVLTTAVVAWVSLTRRTNASMDPAYFAATGDWLFGTPLMMAVLVLLVVQICTGGHAAAVETREVEAMEQQVAAEHLSAPNWTPARPPGS